MSKLENVANYYIEDVDKSEDGFYDKYIKPFETESSKSGNFYDKYIKPYEHDAGSNTSDKIKSPEEDNTNRFFNNVSPDTPEDKLELDPISGDYDYSSIQPDLVEEIVRNFDGYKYDVKQDGNTIIIIFNQDIGVDLVKKWAKVFPDNKFKNVPIEISIKS